MSSDSAEPSQPEAYGPQGDLSRHRTRAELEAGWQSLPPAPKDRGNLHLIVRRHADGTRETLRRVRITPEGGVPGDRWARKQSVNPDAQLAVMRRDVAEMIANGQPLTVFGDNLFVELDLSEKNLPAGTRLRVGATVVEVTPKPHNGCIKFKGRFGQDGLEFVQAKPTRDQNFRGIYWRVIDPGDIEVGDAVEVISRVP
jgi:MOSC domain-containing protein YiiM